MSNIKFNKLESGDVIVTDIHIKSCDDSSIIARITPHGRIEYIQSVPDDIKKEIREYIRTKY